MKTHVIILAQGAQSRLPSLPVAKQLIPLPECGDTPILHRTIRQLWHLCGMDKEAMLPPDDNGRVPVTTYISVVCWFDMAQDLIRHGVQVKLPGGSTPGGRDGHAIAFHPETQILQDPGNSSLKGIAKTLAIIDGQNEISPNPARFDRTVVLLGDVVYSWACLRAIFDVGPPWCARFVGTSDLSRSGGELWGLSWTWEANEAMRTALRDALEKHPPFHDTYQPGQMRRWLWSWHDVVQDWKSDLIVLGYAPVDQWYSKVDDYTMDIDVPAHLLKVPELSAAARRDDEREGIAW